MQGLSQVKEAKGKFVERKFLSVLKQPLESSGTLLFQAPIIWRNTPSPQG